MSTETVDPLEEVWELPPAKKPEVGKRKKKDRSWEWHLIERVTKDGYVTWCGRKYTVNATDQVTRGAKGKECTRCRHQYASAGPVRRFRSAWSTKYV